MPETLGVGVEERERVDAGQIIVGFVAELGCSGIFPVAEMFPFAGIDWSVDSGVLPCSFLLLIWILFDAACRTTSSTSSSSDGVGDSGVVCSFLLLRFQAAERSSSACSDEVGDGGVTFSFLLLRFLRRRMADCELKPSSSEERGDEGASSEVGFTTLCVVHSPKG